MKCIFVVVLLFGVGFAELQAVKPNEGESSEYTNIDTGGSNADNAPFVAANSSKNIGEQSKLNEIEEKSNVDETPKKPKRNLEPMRIPKKAANIIKNFKIKPKTTVDLEQLKAREEQSKSVTISMEARETKSKNALTKAVVNGDAKIVKRLLKEIQKPDPDLLHLAVRKGDVEIVKLLLQNGLDVDTKNAAQGLTPLHTVARSGNVDMIRVLLEHNANVNAKTIYGLTSLMLATAWSTSSYTVKSQIVKLLLRNGADINDVDIGGRTALHEIAFRAIDDVDTVKLLIKFGANVNAREKQFNETPLHKSVHRGNIGVSRVLIENGANVSAVNNAGDSLLHHAARFDRMELAKILLESGAHVNARNNLNSTPLHIIAQLGRDDGEEFAQMLVENGANITARDNLNLTPYDVAKQKGHRAIAAVLNKAQFLAQ